jgi:cytochrome c-type biogenesis protein
VQASRWGPLALLVGVTVSYTLVGTGLALFGRSLGVSTDVVRVAGAVLMLAFGVVLLVPALQTGLTRLLAPLTDNANSRLATFKANSAWGQGVLGLLLGLVWAPCTGPTLGAAITMAARGDTALQAMVVMFAFGIGASTPMGLLALGSRAAMKSNRNRLMAVGHRGKLLMGWGLVLVALMVLTGTDKWLEAQLAASLPEWLLDLTTRF